MRRLLFAAFLVALPGLPSMAPKTCTVTCPPGPPCEEVWKTPVIFAGRVTAFLVEPEGHSPATGRDEFRIRVRFTVTERFRGPDTAEIDLLLPDSACTPNFHVGQSWLVYAVNREGQPGWTVSECTRTRLLSHAAEDLAYLRLPDVEKGTSRVIGRVQHYVVDPLVPRYPPLSTPLKGIRVTATDGTTSSATVTRDDGTYSLQVPWDRDIDVTFGAVPGMHLYGATRARVSHWRGCAVVDGYASHDGRITGSLVDARGRTVPFFPLSLAVSPQALPYTFERGAMTDAAGRFEFSTVDPSTYLIAPSRVLWHQDKAFPALNQRPLAVAPAERVNAGRLTLPSSISTAAIEGSVVDESDRPVARAQVWIRRQGSGTVWIPTEASGKFRVTVIAGESYELRASTSGDAWSSEWKEGGATITAAAVNQVRLKLARTR